MTNGTGLKQQTNQASFKGLKLTIRQKNFLIALDVVALNISVVCKKMGVSRSLYDHWMRVNDDFKIAVSHIEESQVDFAETALKKNIAAGDTKAITYFLDNKGRHRGYGQKMDVNNTVTHKPAELSHLSDEQLLELEQQMTEKMKKTSKK